MSTHESTLLGALLSLVAATACCATGCARTAPSEAEVVRPVKTLVVTPGADTRIRSFPGTVEASRRVELAFRVPGLLVKLPIKEGQAIAKGELIAQLRQEEFQGQLAQAQGALDEARAALQALRTGDRPEEIRRREAELRAAEARLVNARTEYQRNATLLERNVITRQTFEQREKTYRVAQEEYTAALRALEASTIGRQEDVEAMEAKVRGLEGRLVEAEIRLQDSTLAAPYDGVIAQRFVDEGQNIQANDRVVQFQDADEIDIAVDVPEGVMVADIRRADILQLTAELSSAPGIEFPVRIREIAQVADPVTQTFNVRVAMEAPEELSVLPGMSANVTAVYRRASILGQPMLIPVEAIVETPEGRQLVWVLAENGTVRGQPIELGAASGDRVEVLSGLDAGDRIAIAGVRFLREGMRVRDLGNSLGERP